MSDQVGVTAKGGTMRLGKYPCRLAEGSLARREYGTEDISERHRHRYEFNNRFRCEMEAAGLRLSGLSPDGSLVEIVEELPTAGSWGAVPPGVQEPSRPAAPPVPGLCAGIAGDGGIRRIRKAAGGSDLLRL